MLTYKIHLIRHGFTQANLEGRYIGVTDLPLCKEGIEQLERMKTEFLYPAVELVFSSPMKRARQTAQILYPGMDVQIVPDLREFDFGDFEGKTMEELQKDPRFGEWITSPGTAGAPNGESGAALLARIREAMAGIFSTLMRTCTFSAAVITHGGLIANLLADMGLPQREVYRWHVQSGKGFLLLLTTQMWMRDQKFEIYGQLPYSMDMQNKDKE
jgi:alpha-ribazole phosphatase